MRLLPQPYLIIHCLSVGRNRNWLTIPSSNSRDPIAEYDAEGSCCTSSEIIKILMPLGNTIADIQHNFCFQKVDYAGAVIS